MGKDLVKYHNDLNLLNMSNLKGKEHDLFYAICLELKDKQNTEIIIDINEFKKEFNFSNKLDKKRFASYIKNVHNKFLEIKSTVETDKIIRTSNFFTFFETNLETGKMKIKVNEEYIYMLNNIVSKYTRFSYIAYQNLATKYAKILMPQLMQWDSTKRKDYTKEELFEMLGVNEKYKNDLSNFNRKILNPSLKEMKNVFYNLKCTKLKNGRIITGYLFTWERKPEEEKETEIIDNEIVISQKFYNRLNYYLGFEIFEILKDEFYVEKMVEEFGEDTSIKILDKIHQNNKNKKIESFEYFRAVNKRLKTYKIKDKIEKAEIIEKEEQKQIFEPEEIIKLNKKEYDELFEKEYKKHLEKLKQEHNEILKSVFKIQFDKKYEIDIFKDKTIDDVIEQKIPFNNEIKSIKNITKNDKKIYTEKDIPVEKLLSKNGRELKGIARQMRINKLLKEYNEN